MGRRGRCKKCMIRAQSRPSPKKIKKPRNIEKEKAKAKAAQKRYRDKLKNRSDEEVLAAQREKPYKKCSKCKQTLPSQQNFTTLKSRPDGFHSECNSCATKRSLAWASNNRDRYNEYQRNYRKEYLLRPGMKEKLSARQSQRRVRKRGTLTEWELSVSAEYRRAIAGDPCAYCGTTESDAWHIDHVFPISKGGDDRWYNLTRACESCNLSKNARCGTAFRLLKGLWK